MGKIEDLRKKILGTNQKPTEDCEDEFYNSGLLSVTNLDNNSDDCELVRETSQRVGFAMRKLGKSAIVHTKAKPIQGIILTSQQWQADIGVNLKGAKYPQREFKIEPDQQSDNCVGILEIEVWETNSKVKHNVAHDDIPSEPDADKIDTLEVEFTIP